VAEAAPDPPLLVAAPTATLPGLPREVLKRAVSYLDRLSLNNFELTHRGAKELIDDPKMCIVKLWPSRCPIRLPEGSIFYIAFSRDTTRVAVVLLVPDGVFVEVWDQVRGRFGRFHMPDGFDPSAFVYSPDNRLLLILPPRDTHGTRGLSVCQLPIPGQGGAIVLSQHDMNGMRCYDASFVDNNTVLVSTSAPSGFCFYSYEIQRDESGEIRFSEPPYTVLRVEAPQGPDPREFCRMCLLVEKDIIAFAAFLGREISFYDRSRGLSVKRNFGSSQSASIRDMQLSPDECSLLVVLREPEGKSLFYVLDCSGDRVEDLGQPKRILADDEAPFRCHHTSFASLSSPNVAVVLSSSQGYTRGAYRIIDIANDEILAEGPNDSIWDENADRLIDSTWDDSSWAKLVPC